MYLVLELSLIFMVIAANFCELGNQIIRNIRIQYSLNVKDYINPREGK